MGGGVLLPRHTPISSLSLFFCSSSFFLLLFNLLKEPLKMVRLLHEELDLLLPLLLGVFPLLFDDASNGLNLRSLLDNLFLLLLLLFLQLGLPVLELLSAELSLQLFASCECHRAVIEGLVSLDVGVDVAFDSQEKKTAFRHVKSDLADDLLEALLEEFLTHRADALFTSLPLHQLLVKHLTKTSNIDSGSWLRASLLHPVLTYRKQNYALQIISTKFKYSLFSYRFKRLFKL